MEGRCREWIATGGELQSRGGLELELGLELSEGSESGMKCGTRKAETPAGEWMRERSGDGVDAIKGWK